MPKSLTTGGLPILDAEVLHGTSMDLCAEEGVLVTDPKREAIKGFLEVVVEDDELLAVAVKAVARHVYGDGTLVVRPSTIARPPLVLSGNNLGRQSSRYKPFVTPLKALSNDSALALLGVVETTTLLNERFGEFDSTPYYRKGYELTQSVVAKTTPRVRQLKAGAEARFAGLSYDQRRRITAVSVGAAVMACVVTGTVTAEVRGHSTEPVVTTNIIETRPPSSDTPNRGQTLILRNLNAITGDQNNG